MVFLTQQSVLHFVHSHFGLEPAKITLSGGYSNLNFNILNKDCKEYMLRIAPSSRTLKSLLDEMFILQKLKENGFSFQPILKEYHLANRFQLFEKIPGKTPCSWWQTCSFSELKQLFEQLAILHNSLLTIPPRTQESSCFFPYSFDSDIFPLTPLNSTEHRVKSNWKRFCQISYKLIQDILKTFPWQEARYQWLHGDIHLENVLFEHGRFRAFLDFEKASWGPCEMDLIFSGFRVCKQGKTDTPFSYHADHFKKAIAIYRIHNPHLSSDFFSHYDSLWKPFFVFTKLTII